MSETYPVSGEIQGTSTYFTTPPIPVDIGYNSVLPLSQMEERVIQELRAIRERRRHTLLLVRWEFDAWKIYEAAPIAKVTE